MSGHPCFRMPRKILTPARTGKDARDFNMKWEKVLSWMELLWLSIVRKSVWCDGSDHLGRRKGGAGPRQKTRITGEDGTRPSWSFPRTWCTCRTWGRSKSPVGTGRKHGGVSGLEVEDPTATMDWTMLRGVDFHAWWGDLRSRKFWVARWGAYPGRCDIGSRWDLWGRGGHQGAGMLQLPPMHERPTT